MTKQRQSLSESIRQYPSGYQLPPGEACGLGLVVRGGPEQPRQLCDWHRAFAACAECATAAPVGTEGYLSMFTYPAEMTAYMAAHGSCAGYVGATGGPYVWLDFDGPGTLDDVRRLCVHLDGLGGGIAPLVFFSGNKGYHLGIPSEAMGAEPGAQFHATARAFVEALAREADAAGTLDAGIYDRVRIFRAPNSRHPKSGLCKVALDSEEITYVSEEHIREMARTPYPFEIPEAGERIPALARRWNRALVEVATQEKRRAQFRQSAASGGARLNRDTLAFIRTGAPEGERALKLFQAAANLRECGAPERLVFALLEEKALDSGMPALEVHRQIECGFTHGGRGND